jgi:hypothetical protein
MRRVQGSNIGNSKRAAVPTIACINKATTDLGVDFGSLVSALQEYVDDHVAPVWRTPAKLVISDKLRDDAWTMLFVDTADHLTSKEITKITGKDIVKKLEGFHLLRGRPVALVFVQTVLEAIPKGVSPLEAAQARPQLVSIAASHELAEVLVDPGNDLWCQCGNATLYAYEVCDPVEDEHFPVNGLEMTDFVYPTFFQRFQKPNSVQFDHMKKVTRPFEILKGGYAPVNKAGKHENLTGSRRKKQELRKEDRRLHRSEFRRRAKH